LRLEYVCNFASGCKLWAFRRFLRGLAGTTKTEPEIRDEIEWSLNEYQRAMNLHRLKTTRSALELFVIPPLEFAENLLKLNWSKIAKGALSIRKRKVELMEAEMNAYRAVQSGYPGCPAMNSSYSVREDNQRRC
jgi:hypothetical protein